MFDKEFYVEKVANNMESFLASARVRSIMFDIIDLKKENRNIGAKAKVLHCRILDNDFKSFTSTKTERCTYTARVKRDLKTIEYLEKLQKINSKLIMMYRSEIKELRDKIQKGVV